MSSDTIRFELVSALADLVPVDVVHRVRARMSFWEVSPRPPQMDSGPRCLETRSRRTSILRCSSEQEGEGQNERRVLLVRAPSPLRSSAAWGYNVYCGSAPDAGAVGRGAIHRRSSEHVSTCKHSPQVSARVASAAAGIAPAKAKAGTVERRDRCGLDRRLHHRIS